MFKFFKQTYFHLNPDLKIKNARFLFEIGAVAKLNTLLPCNLDSQNYNQVKLKNARFRIFETGVIAVNL